MQRHTEADVVEHPGGAPSSSKTNGKAIASLVLGIVGLTGIPFVASIVALFLGYAARREIRAEGQQGDGLATAGIVLGWVGVVLTTAGVVLATIFLVSVETAATVSPPG